MYCAINLFICVYTNSFQQAAHAALIEAADAKSAALEKLRVQFTAKYAKLAQEVIKLLQTPLQSCSYTMLESCTVLQRVARMRYHFTAAS
jgi:hypothetical protein